MAYFHDPFRSGASNDSSAEEEKQEQPVETGPQVPNGTTREILSWAGDDKERAQAAIDKEAADEHPRKGLIAELRKRL